MKHPKLQHLGSIPTPHTVGAAFMAILLRSSNHNLPRVAEDQLTHQWVCPISWSTPGHLQLAEGSHLALTCACTCALGSQCLCQPEQAYLAPEVN